MKSCMGLASVGYRDPTELVLQWWHSLGAWLHNAGRDFQAILHIRKQTKNKNSSIELQRLIFLFIVISDIFTLQSVVLHEHILCVLDMHVYKLLYTIYYVCEMEGYFLKHLL